MKANDIYDSENFSARVNFAAAHISRMGGDTRTFSACFEMCDGDAVVFALAQRVAANPTSKLAKNIQKYLCKHSLNHLTAKHEHIRSAHELAASMRKRALARLSLV